MGFVTFGITALGIMASEVLDDLDITREQLGYVVTAHVVLGALLSPRAGHVVDRVGGRNAVIGLFAFSGLALAMLGAAVAYWVLIAAAMVSAVAMSAGNPSTNKLITAHVPRGRRGTVTGIKQSGVQASALAGGLLLPIGADAIGWRGTLLVAATGALVGFALVLKYVPRDPPAKNVTAGGPAAVSTSTWWLAGYGALLGFGGTTIFFLPLFSEEAVGYGPRAAGLAAALVGLVSLFGRILWAQFAEERERFVRALGYMAVLSVVAGLLLLEAPGRPWLLWVGVVFMGVSASSWNAVAMLAVMNDSGPATAGRASGVVMFGFLLGSGISSPIYGRIVDVSGSYRAMWWVAISAFAAATVLVLVWSRLLTLALRRQPR